MSATDIPTMTNSPMRATIASADPLATALSRAGGTSSLRGRGMMLLAHAREGGSGRWPMLDLVIDDLARALTPALWRLTGQGGSVRVASISTQPLGAYLGSLPMPAAIAVFEAVPWGGRGLVSLDAGLIRTAVDLLLGGRHGGKPGPAEARPLTGIEMALVERLTRLTLTALAEALAPFAPVELRCERVETNPALAAIERPNVPCVLCRLQMELSSHIGTLDLLIPHATLEPARDRLAHGPGYKQARRSVTWAEHLAHELWHMQVEVEVVLEERPISLRDALGLEFGTVLHLCAQPDSPASLTHDGVKVAAGKVGHSGTRLSLKIEAMNGQDNGGGHA